MTDSAAKPAKTRKEVRRTFLHVGDVVYGYRLFRRISINHKNEVWMAVDERHQHHRRVFKGRVLIPQESTAFAAGTAVETDDDEYVVVKATWRGGTNELWVRQAYREAQILKYLSHPSIIDIIEDKCAVDFFVTVTECFNGIPLRQFGECHEFTKQQEMEILFQAAMAVDHMHSRHIAHRDLHPDNILISDDGMKIKIIDFDFAEDVYIPEDHEEEEEVEEEEKDDEEDTPKETLIAARRERASTAKAFDMWCLGGLLHLMIFEQNLFEDGPKLLPLRYPFDVDTLTGELLDGLLCATEQRMDISDLLQHDYWEQVYIGNELYKPDLEGMPINLPSVHAINDIAAWLAGEDEYEYVNDSINNQQETVWNQNGNQIPNEDLTPIPVIPSPLSSGELRVPAWAKLMPVRTA